MKRIVSTALPTPANETSERLRRTGPIWTGHSAERSAPLDTSTESLRTAAGAFPFCVYTNTFLSKRPGCPFGLYFTLISAFCPGSTSFIEQVADAHEQVETSLSICRVEEPSLVKAYTKICGASSSFIGSATMCLTSNRRDAESALRRGLETSSSLS